MIKKPAGTKGARRFFVYFRKGFWLLELRSVGALPLISRYFPFLR